MEVMLFVVSAVITLFIIALVLLFISLLIALMTESKTRAMWQTKQRVVEQKTIPPPLSPVDARVFARPRVPTPLLPRPRLYTPPPAAATPEIPPDAGDSQPDEIPTEDDRDIGPRPVEDPSDGGSNITLMEFVTPAPAKERSASASQTANGSSLARLFYRRAQRIKTTRDDQ